MDDTDQYYHRLAADFYNSTIGVYLTPIRQRFLAGLQPQGHILEADCGSGREANAFADAGFRVSAFDASAELAKLDSAHCGFDVSVC